MVTTNPTTHDTTLTPTQKDRDLQLIERKADYAKGCLIESCREAAEILESFAKKMLREIDHYATESAPERLADLPANLLEESTWHVASAVKKLSHAMRMAAEHASTLATIKTLKSE